VKKARKTWVLLLFITVGGGGGLAALCLHHRIYYTRTGENHKAFLVKVPKNNSFSGTGVLFLYNGGGVRLDSLRLSVVVL